MAPTQFVGVLALPPGASGVVVLAHGGVSGRLSPRTRAVAAELGRAGLGALLVDLLTAEEEDGFDTRLLADRVIGAIDWLVADAAVGDLPPGAGALPVGCFGAGTGAAAGLIAAAERPHRVGAVVSCGGRLDLADEYFGRVTAPTLLIVGERDADVLSVNRRVHVALAGDSRLEVVPRAGHLFEEPGALERVAALARDWFLRDLGSARAGACAG